MLNHLLHWFLLRNSYCFVSCLIFFASMQSSWFISSIRIFSIYFRNFISFFWSSCFRFIGSNIGILSVSAPALESFWIHLLLQITFFFHPCFCMEIFPWSPALDYTAFAWNKWLLLGSPGSFSSCFRIFCSSFRILSALQILASLESFLLLNLAFYPSFF